MYNIRHLHVLIMTIQCVRLLSIGDTVVEYYTTFESL